MTTDSGAPATAPLSQRVVKPSAPQRITKQLSQGSVNFMTKPTPSQKTIVRLSENSLNPQKVQKTTFAGKSARTGSIASNQQQTREFGREIAANSNAMQAVSQQTVQIMQGKLKPNVSLEAHFQSYAHLSFASSLQQVAKKSMMTYRTNTLGEKPLTAFASQTSLNPLHNNQLGGPGQKFSNQTATSSQAQLLKKSKSNLGQEMQ